MTKQTLCLKQSKKASALYEGKQIAVVGMGVTGRATVNFLLKAGAVVIAFDQREMTSVQLIKEIVHERSDQTNTNINFNIHKQSLSCRVLNQKSDLKAFDYVVLSPGVDPAQPALAQVVNLPSTISDLDIFASINEIPCIGVTGSNGKSTVVDLLQKTLTACGKKALLGGNFGFAALDLLGIDADFVVLELSSFQLAITRKLELAAACILNVTDDHMDRHHSFENYLTAKQAIFKHAKAAIVNVDDAHTQCPPQTSTLAQKLIRISPFYQAELDFSQSKEGLFAQSALLMKVEHISLALPHILLNMQFVLGIHKALNVAISPALKVFENYKGLPHRFELVHEHEGVKYINDSKATNVGACLSALSCAYKLGWRTILIAGGDAKGAQLSALAGTIEQCTHACFVFGKDADAFVSLSKKVEKVDDLEQALAKSHAFIRQQTHKQSVNHAAWAVLLSPACASIDMYRDYTQRGDAFKRAVMREAA